MGNIHLDRSVSGHSQKKEKCPSCGRYKRFVRYYDFDKAQYLPEKYGRCDREEHCGYFEHPFTDDEQAKNAEHTTFKHTPPPAVIKQIDKNIVKQTMKAYDHNPLVVWLSNKFGQARAMQTAFTYYLGTAQNNGTIYWYIDDRLRVRTAKRMFYKPDGHRDRDQLAKHLYLVEDGYKPCLFGLHLCWQSPDDFIVCIVEAEKTAMMAAICFPTVNNRPAIWLAAGSANGLTAERIEPLRGLSVVLAPDFSFHARATWGMFPMRKKRNEKGNLVPHPDGELMADHESAADRFKRIGCTVSFFDPCPTVMDGSDIGDYLEGSPEDPTDVPIRGAGPLAAKIEDKPAPAPAYRPLDEVKAFRISGYVNGCVQLLTDDPRLRPAIEKMMNHEAVQYMVESFNFTEGTIKKL